MGLKKSRASTGAALTYWVSNPLLNPATIVFTAFVLSWQWALLRLVGGIVLVATIAIVGIRLAGRNPSAEGAQEIIRKEDEAATLPSPAVLLANWVKTAAKFAMMIIPEWFVIVLALGAARAWLFPALGSELSFGIIALVLLAVAGTLFVIPTAGEVPVVQSLLVYGVAPGLAGALLLTLPAVSLPSLYVVRRAFPTRLLAGTMLVVAVAGIATGLVAQLLL